MASAENVKRSKAIVEANGDRRFIVVSAPGKKNKDSKKITDLLMECYKQRFCKSAFDISFADIRETFCEIASLVPDFDIEKELSVLYSQIKNSEANLDFVLSRGEYLNAKIIARFIGYEFLDATAFIRFKNGELDMEETLAQAQALDQTKRYVIPGFYGLDEHGHIKTFSRGGGDISGSVVSRVFACDLYENWTDVDGIYISDPRVVENAKNVSQVSYRELREMSYMGASVLHAETLLPIFEQPIPIVIKNTFAPELAGTQILKKRTEVSEREAITCITGKNDYTCIQISKMMLDKQLGFVKKTTSVFEEYGLNISHTHSGLDNLCFFVEASEFKRITFQDFLKELKSRISADKIKGYEKMALVAVIGHNLSGKVGVLAKIFNALKEHQISAKTIYQSISECNIIIGVENDRLLDSVKALYQELIEKE